jgi:hypothetical protein
MAVHVENRILYLFELRVICKTIAGDSSPFIIVQDKLDKLNDVVMNE